MYICNNIYICGCVSVCAHVHATYTSIPTARRPFLPQCLQRWPWRLCDSGNFFRKVITITITVMSMSLIYYCMR